MRVEFNQGVPKECIDWLWRNVGDGNVIHSAVGSNIRRERQATDVWFYERISYEIPSTSPNHDSGTRHVPTITIYDEKLATIFALRWA